MSKNDNDLVVGVLSQKVIDTFNLNMLQGQSIYCGESNRNHMKKEHPKDFEKYGDKIDLIIQNPDFIAKHPRKNSIEYIKVFKENNDYVLVAVRASGAGQLFARTLFIMDDEKVDKYTLCNALKPYK